MNIRSIVARCRKSQEGTVLVFVAVSLAVLLGFVALSFDLGRISVTQTELQSYADNVALAAAGELDGTSNAITRATSAAAAMIEDSQTFGGGGGLLSGAGGRNEYTLRFLKSLPASDTAALTDFTTDPLQARFVEVVVADRNVDWIFGAAFSGLRGETRADARVGAVAVAGFNLMACDVTPLMFCMPAPVAGKPWSAKDNVGQLIRLRAGGNEAWGPGNFGFLDLTQVDGAGPCAGLKEAQLTRCLLGATDFLTQCYNQNSVDTDPGQSVGIEDVALNVRFDIYNGNFSGKKSDSDYPPAPNVIKGVIPSGGGTCVGNNPTPSLDTLGLPRDTCFAAGDCGPAFGDGFWDETAYLAKNYPKDPASTNPNSAPPNINELFGPGKKPLRWDLYLAEIEAAEELATADLAGTLTPDQEETIAFSVLGTSLSETSGPICATPANPPSVPERRVLIAAAVNCDTANGGVEIKGKTTGVPVEEFIQIFMTEPVGAAGGSSFDIWGEVIGSAEVEGSNGAAVIRDVVQLYR